MNRLIYKWKLFFEQNKSVKKYLLYAIGEILLVMIGILLALQVNNWNEERKNRIREKEVLEALHQSLSVNFTTLEESKRQIEKHIQSSRLILEYLDSNQAYSDTLNRHLRRAIPIGLVIRGRLNESGYKALEATGYDILLDKELRSQVINLFETILPTIVQFNADFAEWYNIYMADAFKEYFLLKDGILSPLDPEGLRKDPYFRNILEDRLRQKRWALDLVSSSMIHIQSVLELIYIDKKD